MPTVELRAEMLDNGLAGTLFLALSGKSRVLARGEGATFNDAVRDCLRAMFLSSAGVDALTINALRQDLTAQLAIIAARFGVGWSLGDPDDLGELDGDAWRAIADEAEEEVLRSALTAYTARQVASDA